MNFTVKKEDEARLCVPCSNCPSDRIIKPARSGIFHCEGCGHIAVCGYCNAHDGLSFHSDNETQTFSCRHCGSRWVPPKRKGKTTVVRKEKKPSFKAPSDRCGDCDGPLMYDNMSNEFCPACIGRQGFEFAVKSSPSEQSRKKPRRRPFRIRCPKCGGPKDPSSHMQSFRYYCECSECSHWFEIDLPGKKIEGIRCNYDIKPDEYEKFVKFRNTSWRDFEAFMKFRQQTADINSSLDEMMVYVRSITGILEEENLVNVDPEFDEYIEGLKTALHYLRATVKGISQDDESQDDLFYEPDDDCEDWTDHDRMYDEMVERHSKNNRDRTYLNYAYSDVDIEDVEGDETFLD